MREKPSPNCLCLIKPVSPAVLVAKVSIWLRRSWVVPVSILPDLEAGGLCLVSQKHEVVIEGKRVASLTNIEFRLLTLLTDPPLDTGSANADLLKSMYFFPDDVTFIPGLRFLTKERGWRPFRPVSSKPRFLNQTGRRIDDRFYRFHPDHPAPKGASGL